MTKLFIVRHGETYFNIEKRFQGRMDSPLTEKGIKQALLLAERLADTDIDVIYTSSLGRAVQTAELIKGTRNIKIIKSDELREMYIGAMEGNTTEELKVSHKERYHNFWKAPHKYIPDGGETFEEVRERIFNEVSRVAKEYKDKNVLIVSHSVALKSLLAKVQGLTIEEIWNPPILQQTSLSILEYNNGKYEVKMYGDTSHLNEENETKVTKAV